MGIPKRQYPLGKYRLRAGKHPDKSNRAPLYWNTHGIGRYSGKLPIFLSANVTGINIFIRAEAVSEYHTDRNQHEPMRCSLPV